MKYQLGKNRKNGFAVGGLLLALAIIILIGGGIYSAIKKYQPAPPKNPILIAPVPPLSPASSTSTEQVSPHPTKPPPQNNNVPHNPEKKCVVSGCSGEICADNQVNSICIYKPEFACYTSAHCQLQSNGTCGWTQTPELKTCLAKQQSASPPPVQPTLQPTPSSISSTPKAQSFAIEADDRGFYPPDTITVSRGTSIILTLKVRTDNVYYGGLTFRSAKFNDLTLKPGASGSIQFIADENTTIASFWPLSGVHKADLHIVIQ